MAPSPAAACRCSAGRAAAGAGAVAVHAACKAGRLAGARGGARLSSDGGRQRRQRRWRHTTPHHLQHPPTASLVSRDMHWASLTCCRAATARVGSAAALAAHRAAAGMSQLEGLGLASDRKGWPGRSRQQQGRVLAPSAGMGLGQRFLTVRVVYTVSEIASMRLNAAHRCVLAPLLRPPASWPTGGRAGLCSLLECSWMLLKWVRVARKATCGLHSPPARWQRRRRRRRVGFVVVLSAHAACLMLPSQPS